MNKKNVLAFLCIIVLFFTNRYIYAQEVDFNIIIVQYKLNNHDSISLKWNSIKDADAYYIYRKDTKTGKKVRYTKPICDTETTINNLSAETEYIFSVAPIKKNGNKLNIGKESSGTTLTTPKEWYYYDDYDIDYKRKKMKSYYFRNDYAKTKEERINLGDIKAVDEIIYSDGWYYVIGDYEAITAYKNYPWELHSGDNCEKCIARIREDGTDKEILMNYFSAEGWEYNYQITENAIYIRSYHRDIYESKKDCDSNTLIRYYSDPEWCWLKKITLKTGKIETVLSSYPINWFYYYNGNIYYEYDDSMALSEEKGAYYISDWYNEDTEMIADVKTNYSYCYRIKDNGSGNQLIQKRKYDIKTYNAMVFDNYLILERLHSINLITIPNKEYKTIYDSNEYIYNVSFENGYIYFTESNSQKNDRKYCRIKTDGTGLEKQNKPFEWFY